MTGKGTPGNGTAAPALELMTAERPFDRAALEEPFAPELVKQRPGSFGKTLDYVEWNKVVERVNAVTDNRWSCRVEWVQKCVPEEKIDPETGEVLTYPSYWAALVTVIIPSLGSRSQVGTGAIQGEEVDCLKAAISDGLKKSLTLFGVGLHLYDEGSGNGARPGGKSGPPARRPRSSPDRRPQGRLSSGGAAPPARETPAPPAPATDAQQRAIFAISQHVGFTSAQVADLLLESYGVEQVEALSKEDASSFISWLQAQEG